MDNEIYRPKLQVWHIPQIPGKAFNVDVESVTEAVKVMETLAAYDQFQYDNNIKPDYSNMNGLNIFNEIDQEYYSWDAECDLFYTDSPKEFLSLLIENNMTEDEFNKNHPAHYDFMRTTSLK
ncbi:superinfection exclusion protein [Morganella morganii]|jgi:hypothetical protein|uniref:hypothetical protein n=1 Tax=Morganella morganii TaxID=582 RepID=UPI00076AEED9|nr:hypothetical protein [Morganella morganii]SSN09890.1 Uncharacterised protein [Klebsiella pneumoniae]EJD6109780.1 superinfection exclusion protein [Morganella morganii]EJG2208702.1 superinfection exclusion protein [Morganella morganii]EKU4014395.1 superinfection exclusion protein [Morganella morganii]EMB8446603.1 superinfection exclusion protein [Morganella morganii]